uniref:Uncharacterized protein n=1 Tax=Pipistrellus kuhlii TaxID=59472 RepID=A0A7J7UTS5_PIPKU|nr:hypothetical protein mPipKuh1_008687 [Pipistrellus kuhlii]
MSEADGGDCRVKTGSSLALNMDGRMWEALTALAGGPLTLGWWGEDTGLLSPQKLGICCRGVSSRRGRPSAVGRSQEAAALEGFGTMVLCSHVCAPQRHPHQEPPGRTATRTWVREWGLRRALCTFRKDSHPGRGEERGERRGRGRGTDSCRAWEGTRGRGAEKREPPRY